jgi:hypothetical protein
MVASIIGVGDPMVFIFERGASVELVLTDWGASRGVVGVEVCGRCGLIVRYVWWVGVEM